MVAIETSKGNFSLVVFDSCVTFEWEDGVLAESNFFATETGSGLCVRAEVYVHEFHFVGVSLA